MESAEPVCDYWLEGHWFCENTWVELGEAEGVHVAGALASFQDQVLAIVTWSYGKAPIRVL
jgi:hypothetical protein